MKAEIKLVQNGNELPDFLTGVSVGNSSDTEYPEQVTNAKPETLSSVPGLSAGAAIASGSAQDPLRTCISPSVHMAWGAFGSSRRQAP